MLTQVIATIISIIEKTIILKSIVFSTYINISYVSTSFSIILSKFCENFTRDKPKARANVQEFKFRE